MSQSGVGKALMEGLMVMGVYQVLDKNLQLSRMKRMRA